MPRYAQAISASPHPFEVTQPDVTKVMLRIRGDEYFHWNEDMKGYTVVRSNGRYVYAQLNKQGRLAPTSWEVGKVNPKEMGLARKILPVLMRQINMHLQWTRHFSLLLKNEAVQQALLLLQEYY